MIILLYSLSILFMILLPVGLAILLRRRFETPWILFSVGALTFAVSQVVHIPLNNWLSSIGVLPGKAGTPSVWQTAIVIGLTAGLCEELARTGGYFLMRKARSLADGLMLGLGHGGFEAMTFVGVQLAASITTLVPLLKGDWSSLNLPPDQLAVAQKSVAVVLASPWSAFLPAIERIFAIGIHVTFSVMVLRAFQKRQPAWVLLAILYHAFVDAAAVYSVQAKLIDNQWVLTGLFILVCLPGYVWLYLTYRKEAAAIPARHVSALQREWEVYTLGVKKELLQAWRTRRFLVIAAVFGLFGFLSPLSAYFLPQMFKLIPGGEQFAGLFPAATAGDAMYQYVKNITQFGFILALLIGMGAVAGEKEHGTASLVLSKPMTRWAFVFSKLTAQVILYMAGFAVSLLCAYFYSIVLFGSLNLGEFLLMNLVLLVWLLPFAALTLVGSVAGKSTGAAAGVALVLVIVLMLASSLPVASSLLPGSLTAWANQLGYYAAGVKASTPGTPDFSSASLANGAALASSLVIVLMGLLVSIGLFEQQELE